MSRVGKTAIVIPEGVEVTLGENFVEARGKQGNLLCSLSEWVSVTCEDNKIIVRPQGDSKKARTFWGTTQRNVSNIIRGVDTGFKVNLELSGVGYRAQVQGSNLVLQLGFSHEVVFPIPQGAAIRCEKPTMIEITGADKQQLGQIAAEIIRYRKPEPYKGKGVIKAGTYVVRKEGKKK